MKNIFIAESRKKLGNLEKISEKKCKKWPKLGVDFEGVPGVGIEFGLKEREI